jgi:hypothetical protein
MGPGGMGGPGFQNAEELVIAKWIGRPAKQPQGADRPPEEVR